MFGDLDQRLKAWIDSQIGDATSSSRDGRSGRMVREVNDPRFLHEQLAHIKDSVGSDQLLSDARYGEAFAELDRAGQTQPQADVFIPRTATNSILQSVLTTCIEERADSLVKDAPEGLERLSQAVLQTTGLFREFGPCDPQWMETKIAEGIAMIEHKPPFPADPAPPVRLADDARVVVVGDWGTGLPGAVAVAEHMRAELEQERGREQHVVHLGDVYYSGWREEYQSRFLRYWPVDPGDREVLSWSLNGNHDMYSGGHGYFGFLLRDPRFRGHWLAQPNESQSSSRFSLENDHWQLLGLDSSYEDHDLAGTQFQWLAGKLDGSRRRTMVLTHHQPFSAYEQVSQAMTDKVKQALGAGKLDAWIWGHEHRCVVYERNPAPYLSFGSCIGHGGVPRLLPDPSPTEPHVEWALLLADQVGGDQWGRFGFAVLDFSGPEVLIRYIDETGTTNHQERL